MHTVTAAVPNTCPWTRHVTGKPLPPANVKGNAGGCHPISRTSNFFFSRRTARLLFFFAAQSFGPSTYPPSHRVVLFVAYAVFCEAIAQGGWRGGDMYILLIYTFYRSWAFGRWPFVGRIRRRNRTVCFMWAEFAGCSIVQVPLPKLLSNFCSMLLLEKN